MNFTKERWVLRCTLAILFAMFPLFSQGPAGSVSGSVLDPSGARVPGASVTIRNVQTNESHRTATNDSGDYVFPSIAAGEYEVVAQAQGFKQVRRAGVVLEVNQNARVDFPLEIGGVNEAVQVKADAPLVDTRESQVGATVDSHGVLDLPLDGRNVYDLMALMPGVTGVSTSLTGALDQNHMNVNGARAQQNNFYLDGAFNNALYRNGGNVAPNPDAVQEFHLITSNFTAEYGRLPGSVMNVVTRSGTNLFHGTLFEFLRNDSVNARSFFQASVTPLKRNQFGFSLGGPLRKDRTFFFFSYQGLRLRIDNAANGILVPTAAQRQGDFSTLAASKWPLDPTTGKAFPNGMIPVARLDPVARSITDKLIPLPNQPNGTLSSTAAAPTNDDQFTLKIDHQLTSTHRLSGTLFRDHSNVTSPFAGSQIPNWSVDIATYPQYNVVVSDDWIVTPSLINQARFNYTYSDYNDVNPTHTSWPDFGSQVALGATPAQPPQMFVNGYWQAGNYGVNNQLQTTYGISDVLSWTRGGHTIKAGASVLWNHYDCVGNWLGAGQIRFTGAFTGNAQADFLMGMAASFRQNNGLNFNLSGPNTSLFLQDDWKASRRLTLNLGVRWELNPPLSSVGNQLGSFRPGVQSQHFPTAPLGMIFPGDTGVSKGLVPTAYTNFSPRVGFAYDVFGNGRTAIRGGYGIFYAVAIANQASIWTGQPFLVDITLYGTPNLVNPWASSGGSPFPYTPNPQHAIFTTPITVDYPGEGWGTPYVQQYNLTVEQQLGPSNSVQAAYVGNTSRKLYIGRDTNAPVYIPGNSTASNVNNRRPYMPGTFGTLTENETAMNASYNSLQLTFKRRFARGVSFLANYSRSKSIDILSNDVSALQASSSVVDANNFALDRAVSDFNVPQSLALSWVWEVPKVHRWSWIGKEVLSGWQLNGIMTARSGLPLNITSGVDSNLDGNTNDRPNLVGDPNLPGGRSRAAEIRSFFNTAAFAKVATGQLYGNVGRNLLRGPDSLNWNMSAFKEFALLEKHRLQFRTDAFNVFNEVNFGLPNAVLTSAAFGRITAAGSPRILQFGLKYIF